MLDKVTTNPQPAPAQESARAIDALAWAGAVGTVSPDALGTPPVLPTPDELRSLRVDTLRNHLDRMLLGRHTQEGLDALHVSGVLEVWLPEVFALIGFGDGEWRHKDVWKHTMQVVWQSGPRL